MGQQLTLMPQRAVFWREQATLIIADLHLGKAAAFRRGGIAVPAGTTRDDLKRLGLVLAWTSAATLLILGDMMHGVDAWDHRMCREFGQWRRHWADLEIVLVGGNHDRRAGPPPAEYDIRQIRSRYSRHPFGFLHRPQPSPDEYVMAGHRHPAVRLRGAGRQDESLPCFCFGREYAVLPAFGGFTGCAEVRPKSGDRLFVIADKQVIELESKSLSKSKNHCLF
jgi:DNA ligase-associated metallophosphoesterase